MRWPALRVARALWRGVLRFGVAVSRPGLVIDGSRVELFV
jgi:hypothetical protein